MNGDREAAMEQYQLALHENENNSSALNNLGYALATEGRWEEAEKYYRQSLELNDQSDSAHVNLANALAALRQYEAAEQHLQTALALNPESAIGLESYARLHTLRGDLPQAIAIWQQAVSLYPDHLPFRLELAGALAGLQHFDEAITHYRQVVARDPEHQQALTSLGTICLIRNDYGLSQDYLKKALGLVPENTTARYYLALNYLSLGRQPEALTEFQRILYLTPDDHVTRTDLAVVLIALERYEEADTHLQRVLQQVSHYPKAVYYMGVLKHLQKEFGEARQLLKNLAAGPEEGEYNGKAREYLETYFSH